MIALAEAALDASGRVTPKGGPPTMYRVKTPAGFTEHALPAPARAAYEQAKQTLKQGEKASIHACAHHGGPGPPTDPAVWWNCRDDPRAEYEEYVNEIQGRLGQTLDPVTLFVEILTEIWGHLGRVLDDATASP